LDSCPKLHTQGRQKVGLRKEKGLVEPSKRKKRDEVHKEAHLVNIDYCCFDVSFETKRLPEAGCN